MAHISSSSPLPQPHCHCTTRPSNSAHRGLVADAAFHDVLMHLALNIDGALANPASDHGSTAALWRRHRRVGWGVLSGKHSCLAPIVDPTEGRKPFQEERKKCLWKGSMDYCFSVPTPLHTASVRAASQLPFPKTHIAFHKYFNNNLSSALPKFIPRDSNICRHLA